MGFHHMLRVDSFTAVAECLGSHVETLHKTIHILHIASTLFLKGTGS